MISATLRGPAGCGVDGEALPAGAGAAVPSKASSRSLATARASVVSMSSRRACTALAAWR